ncbi:MAG: hypothetical protein LBJ72_02385 [Dysgonamonadaceae bacterium]|jgi:hypothetical protein|nr:hypothetical protein [Dysgonamonadaceae bacterium]
MKKVYIFCIFILFCAISCLEDVNMPKERQNVDMPTLKAEVPDPNEITYKSAVIKANIESASGYKIISRGFIYGSDRDLNERRNIVPKPLEDNGTGRISHEIEGLTPYTDYYFVAYAENTKGTRYSDTLVFRTKSEAPIVKTENAVNISDGSATFPGAIVSEGAAPIEECGICWSLTSENPAYNIDKTYRISGMVSHFDTILHKMSGSATYYFRAFARNSFGISYGETVALQTPLIWEVLQAFPEGGRLAPATFTISQNFYLAAGEDENSRFVGTVYEYNTTSETWIKRDSLAEARKAPSAFVISNRAYVGFGRSVKEWTSLKDFQYYMPNLNEWNTLFPEFPDRAREYAPAFSINNVGYIIGGRVAEYPRYEILDEVWAYELIDGIGNWKKKEPFPVSIMGGITFASGESVFVGLGMSLSPFKIHNTIWEYQYKTERWDVFTTVPENFDLAEGGVTAVTAIEEEAYVVDGRNQLWILDLRTKEWVNKNVMPGEISPSQCMFSKQHEIYVGIKKYSPAFYKYRPYWDNPLTP